MKRTDTKTEAKGKWRSILREIGFEDEVLSGNHGSCPMCGGDDRFRFTDYKRGGEYFCAGCGPGNGFDLIMKTRACSFKAAAKIVDEALGADTIEEVRVKEVDVKKRREDLIKVWQGATADKVRDDYLIERNCKVNKKYLWDLRGHEGLYLRELGVKASAMVALIRNIKGKGISIHRTFPTARMKKVMPPTENIAGAAVRLGPIEKKMVVGEGIETTLSGCKFFNCPGLATISAYGMEQLLVPREVEHLIILADHDQSFTGQRAAFTLARKMDQEKRTVDVYIPFERGTDYNDLGDGDTVVEFSNAL